MKKTIRIITAIVLTVAIVLCSAWYLFVYDREFTRDLLLSCARGFESTGNHNTAAWFYNMAYEQSDDGDGVAIELAQQYKNSGNFTKAEYTLYNAISNGAGVDVYVALSKLYVEQDKLLDAVNMLNGITNADIKAQLETMRPAPPVATPQPGYYNQYISVTLASGEETVYYSSDKQYPSTKNGIYSSPISLTDGENTILALSLAENGLVSTLAIYGYTVGGVVELVDFQDAAVEAAIRSELNASENEPLYTNDLWGIKSFTVPDGVTSYADIKHMVFLESLTIANGVSDELSILSNLTNITQLSINSTSVSQEVLQSIASIPKLKNLTLSGCSLTSISDLEKASGITTLDLSNNAIRDISSLSNMKELTELSLQHNAIIDGSPLSGLTALTKLDLSHNNLSTAAPFSSLTALTHLDISTNSLVNLGDLSKLELLVSLSLSNNQLDNISTLATCTTLTELNISSNKLTDISALSKLNKLQQLDFSHNEVATMPAWSKSCELVTVNGAYNKLTTLDALGGLEHLNIVNMDYNENIKSIAPLSKCPVLLEVNVYGTKVTDVKSLTSQSVVVNYNPVQ